MENASESAKSNNTTSVKISISLQDIKTVADKVGIPYKQLLDAMLNTDQSASEERDFGPNHPGHPRLLSVVPNDLESIIGEGLK